MDFAGRINRQPSPEASNGFQSLWTAYGLIRPAPSRFTVLPIRKHTFHASVSFDVWRRRLPRPISEFAKDGSGPTGLLPNRKAAERNCVSSPPRSGLGQSAASRKQEKKEGSTMARAVSLVIATGIFLTVSLVAACASGNGLYIST
jgi:hypothetical protein